jgi:hypothetical protein
MRTGEVQANLIELNRVFALPFLEELIQRKQAREQGELPKLDYDWHARELNRWENQLDEAFAASRLPDNPPWEELDRFLIGQRLHKRKN